MNKVIILYIVLLNFNVNYTNSEKSESNDEMKIKKQNEEKNETLSYAYGYERNVPLKDDEALTENNVYVTNNETLLNNGSDVKSLSYGYERNVPLKDDEALTENDVYVTNNETLLNNGSDVNNTDPLIPDSTSTICNTNNKLMIVEGDIVQILYYPVYMSTSETRIWIEKCRTNVPVKTKFNTSLTVGHPEMYLYNIKLPTLPESTIVEKVHMTNVIPIGVFGGCSRLTSLEINSPNLSLVAPNWLSNCSRLINLDLAHLNLEQAKIILNSATHIKELSFSFLSEVSDIVFTPMFPTARGAHQWITTFLLYNYNMKDINPAEDNTNSVEFSESLVWQLSSLPKLEHINVGSLKDFDFCAFYNRSSITLQTVQALELFSTGTNKLCFKELRKMPNLTTLSLANTEMDLFEFGELFSQPSPHIHVQYSFPDFQEFSFTRQNYLALTQGPVKGNVTLTMYTDIDCDCESSLWLARAISDGVVKATGIKCLDGSSLTDQHCNYVYCERIHCESECVCCLDIPGFLGDCRNAIISSFPHELIRMGNITALLIPNYNLTSLPVDLPENLMWLDLSGNDLLMKSEEVELKSLFKVPGRHMLLAGNPINCSCDSQFLINELQEHKDQIEDYKFLVCADGNTSISEVDVPGLCAYKNRQITTIVFVSVLLLLAAAVIIFGSAFYYRRQIRFHARKIKEEEMDVERQYDIFLSYCDDDKKIVIEDLLPILDKEYSVCINDRDWQPGDTISALITRSVEQSRRTVVIVSRNYVKSQWGLLEFKTAFVSGLMEGRVRVVMIVLDDILNYKDIDEELKAYLLSNTYVKWGDPCFWNKLRFALPNRSLPPEPKPSDQKLNKEAQLGMTEMYDVENSN